jgi:uncharacterized protein YjiS (DUF1127 family)
MNREACFDADLAPNATPWGVPALSPPPRRERMAIPTRSGPGRAAAAVRRALIAWRRRSQAQALLGLDAATLRDLAIAPCEAGSVAAELSGEVPATRRRIAPAEAAPRSASVPVVIDLGAGTGPAEAAAQRQDLAAMPGVRAVRPGARLPRLLLVEYDPTVTAAAAIVRFIWRRNGAARLIGL